jgi:hypothetical protein
MPFLILISFTGVAICVLMGTILMWGYANGYNLDVGVREGVQV